MSLDVYLYAAESEKTHCRCECGHEHEKTERLLLYTANITHNLGLMADEAGIYEALWRPEEKGWRTAAQLIEPLQRGLEALRANPERLKALNPSNGWGTYDAFVPWVERYLAACHETPGALVEVWR